MDGVDPQPLERALLLLETEAEAQRFLVDLTTPAELRALRERWMVAQMLAHGLPYRTIAARAPASTTTVARVARALRDMPEQGYRLVLDRLR